MKGKHSKVELEDKMLQIMAASPRPPPGLAAIKFWAASALVLVTILWVCGLQLVTVLSDENMVSKSSFYNPLPAERFYKNNGYLVVIANGGLNQRRLAIIDMVVIARYINVTLIVPLFDKGNYWNDNGTFADIFDQNHFITSLRDEVRILEQLPPELKRIEESDSVYSMVPISFSNLTYYYERVLPRIQKNGVLQFNLTDSRLANNGLPAEIQKLRCRVNYEALRFTQPIEETGRKIVSRLRQKGPLLVLHLRYEKDMVSLTGCTEGLTKEEIEDVTKLSAKRLESRLVCMLLDKNLKEIGLIRYSHPRWKHAPIDAKRQREHGACPLTPEETALILPALGLDSNATIYIAGGKLYNEERRMANLAKAYPNLVRKEHVLEPSELKHFLNHADRMAALDYIVALESDIYIPTYGGNMAKAVEGHRRYLGFKTTIVLNGRVLVRLIDDYNKGMLSRDEFALLVKKSHENLTGKPTRRKELPDLPKYEDNFYSNPQECLPSFAHQPPISFIL